MCLGEIYIHIFGESAKSLCQDFKSYVGLDCTTPIQATLNNVELKCYQIFPSLCHVKNEGKCWWNPEIPGLQQHDLILLKMILQRKREFRVQVIISSLIGRHVRY